MTVTEISKKLHTEQESSRRSIAILRLEVLRSDSGKDTAGLFATDSRAIDGINNAIAEAQRSLNRQKKMLSLLRKNLNR